MCIIFRLKYGSMPDTSDVDVDTSGASGSGRSISTHI